MTTISSKNVLMAAAAIGTVLAISAGTPSSAEEKVEKEKCYGVAVAGKNDCATATSSCAGTSKVDRQTDAFVAIPKGLCLRIAGGTLMPTKG